MSLHQYVLAVKKMRQSARTFFLSKGYEKFMGDNLNGKIRDKLEDVCVCVRERERERERERPVNTGNLFPVHFFLFHPIQVNQQFSEGCLVQLDPGFQLSCQLRFDYQLL